jgi:hypothetical protein
VLQQPVQSQVRQQNAGMLEVALPCAHMILLILGNR